MLLRTVLGVWFLSVGLFGCASFDRLNAREGIRSFQVQDYRHAFVRLKPIAERGQPDAQYAIGYMYYYGQGVVENKQQAFEWIRRAAQAGQADAVEALQRMQGDSLQSVQ